MNAAKVRTSKWTMAIGAAVLVGVLANVSLADPPRGGRGDGYRGDRGGYVDRDRGRDGDRWRDSRSHWRGDRDGYGYSTYVVPSYYPPAYYSPPAYYGGGYAASGCYGGSGITIIIR
jgi:hypothetical protein